MRTAPFYQVDAFADALFRGNPAAVCPFPGFPEWPADELLQAIAEENNLSETAFLLPDDDSVPLRWFTPTEEVPLCGHATLAAGFVFLTFLEAGSSSVVFESRSGPLTVTRAGEGFSLDFPSIRTEPVEDPPDALVEGIGGEPVEFRMAGGDPNYFCILSTEEEVAAVQPDLRLLERLHPYGVAVSAPGGDADFVSRYFAPGYGIPEDPVTGSIHCSLGPYWADRLGRGSLRAVQLSRRRGRLDVRVEEGRVHLTGDVACYLTGEIRLPLDRG